MIEEFLDNFLCACGWKVSTFNLLGMHRITTQLVLTKVVKIVRVEWISPFRLYFGEECCLFVLVWFRRKAPSFHLCDVMQSEAYKTHTEIKSHTKSHSRYHCTLLQHRHIDKLGSNRPKTFWKICVMRVKNYVHTDNDKQSSSYLGMWSYPFTKLYKVFIKFWYSNHLCMRQIN